MVRVMIRLEETEWDAVWKRARSERRDPRDQAAMYIKEGLERHGLLSIAEKASVPMAEGQNGSIETAQA